MKHLNKEQFMEEINSGKAVLAEFWAPWCVYCRRIVPALKQIDAQFAEELSIVQINIDEEPALADQEKIQVIPTLVLYQNGERLASVVNPGSKAAIAEFIQENSGL